MPSSAVPGLPCSAEFFGAATFTQPGIAPSDKIVRWPTNLSHRCQRLLRHVFLRCCPLRAISPSPNDNNFVSLVAWMVPRRILREPREDAVFVLLFVSACVLARQLLLGTSHDVEASCGNSCDVPDGP